MFFSLHADAHDEYPQWDPIHWVIESTDHITLPCTHPRYFPFNETATAALIVRWILPKHTSYRHLIPNTTNEGWRVMGKDQNYTLFIDKVSMNEPEAVDGIYVCAALAVAYPNARDNGIYSWYYLRWGVGLYSNVPAMNSGSIGQKYYWCFTYCWVSCFVALVIVALFSATVHFKYKGAPDMLANENGSDSDSISLSSHLAKKTRDCGLK
ncbi:unnamed protein product [Hymenolepis diminuta]|uniref:Ig-like domain-containing protein n=1 Tax=Hymenolepis diminuta TaxID=6216 RepID=A0A0R3SGB5_HYMDI|nr:unnamed protein product [Hymenolepis diminuta]